MRIGPSTSYKKVGSLNRGDCITRTGIGSNNWSRVKYKGEVAYVSSNYLSTEKPKVRTILDEMNERSGMIGRLTIPDVGVSVALFYSKVTEPSQWIVDKSDSAAYLDCISYGYIQDLIADHVNQGFSGIKKAVPNQTIAKIDYGTYVEKYKCINNFKGRNTGTDLVDLNGNSIFGENNGGIAMYTCNSDDTVTITYWQKVS